MRAVLLSTYDLGHQPLGLASPAAYLEGRGWQVRCFDTSAGTPDPEALAAADLVGFYLPMHTATRLAVPWIKRVKSINPRARLAAYGLYSQLNRPYLEQLGVRWFAPPPLSKSAHYPVPQRQGLKPLDQYAHLHVLGRQRTVGYTEGSHGCKHLCRHCPVVPVYQGQFRIMPVATVMADIRQQVAAGAQHITFGDPDFFNGPTHARRLVEAFHAEFPGLTYDVTIKIEHLLNHRELLPVLRETGCSFITSAVESLNDAVLEKLAKGHSRADFLEAVELVRQEGLTLAPTFIAFTPWTTPSSYREFLATIRDLELVENVAPVQLALRLLITQGSRLLELEDIQRVRGDFHPPSLLYRWQHEDPAMDTLAARLMKLVAQSGTRTQIFAQVWEHVFHEPLDLIPRSAIPYMDEPWYC